MTPERLDLLVNLYSQNKLSVNDCEELHNYLNGLIGKGDLDATANETRSSSAAGAEVLDRVWAKLSNDERYNNSASVKVSRFWTTNMWMKISAAAASVALVCSLSFFPLQKQTEPASAQTTQDILPGKVRAHIEVSDGKYITVTTPKAAEYNVSLPDGSHVWLNANSSLKYKADFAEGEREVVMTGEAYFEVQKSRHKPFYVRVNKACIQVLGTKFNVAAYNTQEVKTSLLEGSVAINTADNSLIRLIPGLQAILKPKGATVKKVDTDLSVAWKNGSFAFQGEDIRSIMQRVSQWYDIEVEFDENIADEKFEGTFSRKKKLSELLQSFETVSSLRFKIEGRRIRVMK